MTARLTSSSPKKKITTFWCCSASRRVSISLSRRGGQLISIPLRMIITGGVIHEEQVSSRASGCNYKETGESGSLRRRIPPPLEEYFRMEKEAPCPAHQRTILRLQTKLI